MYAVRRVHVKQWEHQSLEERYSVEVTRGGKPVKGVYSDRISAIEEEVMYWRKANHIHAWFVDNVQNGVDNCAEYYVSGGKLAVLFDVCQKVIEASNLVPGQVYAGESWSAETKVVEVHRTPGLIIEDATVAQKLLPTREGFFFGCYEYDGDYYDDVVATRDWAERTLMEIQSGAPGSIYYYSSW